MDTSKPGPLLMLAGGVLIIISTFLKWGPDFGDNPFDDATGIGFGYTGLFGIITLLIGIALAALGASSAFGFDLPLPDRLLGLSMDQWALVDAFTVFIWLLAIAVEEASAGVWLAILGSLAAVIGAVLELSSATTSDTRTI